jgi:putative addiction module CopG family antidote
MTTISVPITKEQKKFVEARVKSGKAATVAHAVRQAIQLLEEDEAIAQVLRAEQEISAGKGLRGNLDDLLRAI